MASRLTFVSLVLAATISASELQGPAKCSFTHEDQILDNWNLVESYLALAAASPNPVALYNVADYVNPLLEGVVAIHCESMAGGNGETTKDKTLKDTSKCLFYLDRIAGVLKNGINGTVLRSQLSVPMGGYWDSATFAPPVSVWVINATAPHVYEVTLDSSQFVYTNSRLLHAIAKFVPTGQRTVNMWQFIENMSDLVSKDQVLRWVFGPGAFEVHGWGCSDNELPVNHSVFLQMKFDRAFGRTRGPTYCNAVLDQDMWIVTSVLHLLAAHDADPDVVHFWPAEYESLKAYVTLGVALIESRITTTQTVPNGFSFDVGLWDSDPENVYADYKGDTWPSEKPPQPVNTTWDVSHGQRFVNDLMTLDSLAPMYASPTRSNWTSYLVHQFTETIYNQNCTNPVFSNYLNGDGWYRVGYDGAGWGYGLGDDGCGAAMHGGYGLLAVMAHRSGNSKLGARMSAAIGCVDALVPTAPQNATNPWLAERYFAMWEGYHRHNSTWQVGTLDTALRLIMFYPAVVQC